MTLQLQLEDHVAEPGGAFAGTVSYAASVRGARAIRLTLRFRTEGRGTDDEAVLTEHELALDPSGGLTSTGFVLPVPRIAPISYDGSLIRIIHEVEARLDVKMARDVKVEQRVLVVPVGGIYHYDRPHPLPTNRPLPS